ncbi:hypothetical protein GW17_00014435 [Ensete ventricosum]|nr:hypothetical protein GW17_00014435 [Ensete ventricosum]
MFIAWYGRYIPVRQVASTRTARYRAVPPKIDRRRSISAIDGRLKGEIDRRRSIEREKGRKKKRKKKKKKRKEEKKYLSPARGPRLCAVIARALSPPAGRGRSFSRAGRKIEVTSPQCFTGIDDPYEPPLNCEIEIQQENGVCPSPCAMAGQVVGYLEEKGFLRE